MYIGRVILVYRYRVKSLNGLLNKQARAVNFVWNFFNDTQKHALKWGKKWPTWYDLEKLTAGSSKELGLNAETIGAIAAQYSKSRTQKNRPYLRYRGAKSLGWVPLKGRTIRETPDGFHFHGREFKVFKSRDLPAGAKIKDGTNFSRDARGNWFLNVCIDVPAVEQRPLNVGVGVDLGLKSFAVLSTGESIDSPRLFRRLEEQIGKAQRANKKRQVANIHARIASARHDFLHKLSHRLVHEFDYIAVGNVSASKLAKTSMAKSVNDAGWSSFRAMLAYKAIRHGAWFEEVKEGLSSQTCSSCGSLPDSRPKGIAGLGIRNWVCSSCGVSHDRDTNAALNILSRHGHVPPIEGVQAA